MKIYRSEGNDKEWSRPALESVKRLIREKINAGEIISDHEVRIFRDAWLEGFYFGIRRFQEHRKQ